jgi:hypothetical protein
VLVVFLFVDDDHPAEANPAHAAPGPANQPYPGSQDRARHRRPTL